MPRRDYPPRSSRSRVPRSAPMPPNVSAHKREEAEDAGWRLESAYGDTLPKRRYLQEEESPPPRTNVGWKPVSDAYTRRAYRPRKDRRAEREPEPESWGASLLRWFMLFLVVILIAFSLVTLMDHSVRTPTGSWFSSGVMLDWNEGGSNAS